METDGGGDTLSGGGEDTLSGGDGDPMPPETPALPSVPSTHRIVTKSEAYLLSAALRACRVAGLSPTVHNISKALCETPTLREEVKRLKIATANALVERDKADSKNKHLLDVVGSKNIQIKGLQQVKRRKDATIDSLEQHIEAREAYWRSAEFQKATVHQWVISHIEYTDEKTGQRRYRELFKQKSANFAQQCASLRRTAGAAHTLFEAIGLDMEKIKVPHRSTTTTFKIIEAEAGVRDWLKGVIYFGVNIDSSKRGDKDILLVSLFGWHDEHDEPEHKLALTLDIGGVGNASTLGQVLYWVVYDHFQLDPAVWCVNMSDNTNAMSGTGTGPTRKGRGCFWVVRRMEKNLIVRGRVHMTARGALGLRWC